MPTVRSCRNWQQETPTQQDTATMQQETQAMQLQAQAMQKAEENPAANSTAAKKLTPEKPLSAKSPDENASHFAMSFDQKLRLLRLREISLPAWSEYADIQHKLGAVARLVGDTAPTLLHYFYIAHAKLQDGLPVPYAEQRLLLLLLELEQIGLVVMTPQEEVIEGSLSSRGHEFLHQLQLMMGGAFAEMSQYLLD